MTPELSDIERYVQITGEVALPEEIEHDWLVDLMAWAVVNLPNISPDAWKNLKLSDWNAIVHGWNEKVKRENAR